MNVCCLLNRRQLSAALLGILLITSSLGCSEKIVARPELIKEEEVVFTPPAIQNWTAPNGLEVLLLEDHQLPLVEGDIYFRFGSLHEEVRKRGVTDALMSQLRSGGIKGLTPQELDAKLDAVGASVEGSAGGEFSSLAFFSHKDDNQLVFQTLKGLLTAPAFDEERLRLWKTQALSSIPRRRETPEIIAGATFSAALYGENSVYGSLPDERSLKSISSKTLRELQEQKLLPQGSMLTVSGDITRKELEALIDQHLSDWKGAPVPSELPVANTANKKPGLYFVKTDLAQSSVIIGHEGPARLSKDLYAISVFNRYFARGGFNSVLFQEVRSRNGYAYSVDGGFAPGSKTGEFEIGMGTRSEATEAAVQEVLKQFEVVRANLPDPAKISEVKRAVKQGFIFNFARPSTALSREATLRLLGYPKDFDKTYISNLTAVTPEEVNQVAASRISPDSLIVVVVGKLDGKALAKNLGIPFYPVEFVTKPVFKKAVSK